MEVKNLCQRDNTLQARFVMNNNIIQLPFTTKLSPEYIISEAAVFQVKLIIAPINIQNYGTCVRNFLIFIRFVKLRQDDDLTYAIKFTSTELKLANKNFISDDGTWHLIYVVEGRNDFSFNITVLMDIISSANSFAPLHEDTELTDFELRGEDGSVRMHRAVLAAASPVLRRMLGGTWREAAEGKIDVKGTSKVTLQYLKDYIYLHTLPDNGLEQLLLLASYYMMQDLEQKCINKLVASLTAENACDLLEFAMEHKVTGLVLSILECVQSGAVKVNEMRKHFLRSE